MGDRRVEGSRRSGTSGVERDWRKGRMEKGSGKKGLG